MPSSVVGGGELLSRLCFRTFVEHRDLDEYEFARSCLKVQRDVRVHRSCRRTNRGLGLRFGSSVVQRHDVQLWWKLFSRLFLRLCIGQRVAHRENYDTN